MTGSESREMSPESNTPAQQQVQNSAQGMAIFDIPASPHCAHAAAANSTTGTLDQDTEMADGQANSTAGTAPTAAGNAALVAKYGSLYAADEEKARRRFFRRKDYGTFKRSADGHELAAQHLADRNKIWEENREKEETKLLALKAEMDEVHENLHRDDSAQEALNRQLGPDAEAWEADKETMAKYKAYFELESDELEV
ncbi:hypothetical protein LTR27_011361 [Elasticomyces elasticus]|nr:hypothetical protein LTR27_011361 [Elasticomyces elasticus]